METFDHAVWGVIVGLALMLVGGLVLWAYGARSTRTVAMSLMVGAPEAEATCLFHAKLIRWFLAYGLGSMAVGLILVIWCGLSL